VSFYPSSEHRYLDITTHPLIADLCVNLAEEIYEELCSGSNAIYKVQGDRQDFIKQCAPTLKQHARILLGAMLGDPKVNEWEKENIYNALTLDNELPRHGTSIIHKSQL
jgi:hypothetical protein